MRAACGAGEGDAVIFTGTGCTGAVQTLINMLGVRGIQVGAEAVLVELRKEVVVPPWWWWGRWGRWGSLWWC